MAAAAGLLRLEARLNHAHHRDDAYASLDVGYDASEADVRRAFISHSRLAHPDKWGQQDGDAGLQATATALFAAISGASEVLLGGGEQRKLRGRGNMASGGIYTADTDFSII